VLIFLLALIGGSSFYLETFFHFLRVRSISFSPLEETSESLFWKKLKPEDIRWWPLLYLHKNRISREIERSLPVKANLQIIGLGHLEVKVASINPSFIVIWENMPWFVDLSGKIWGKYRVANMSFPATSKDLKPALKIGKGFPAPLPEMDLTGTEDTVFQSLLPMDLISGWMKALRSLPWFDNIDQVVMRENAGAYLLLLRIRTDKGWIDLLVKPDHSKWLLLAEALGRIMPKFPLGYSNIFIDATYEDKIIVRDKDNSSNN